MAACSVRTEREQQEPFENLISGVIFNRRLNPFCEDVGTDVRDGLGCVCVCGGWF